MLTGKSAVPTENNIFLNTEMSDSAKFRAEQLADTALAHCWKLARAKKAGFFFIQNDLLYHQHNVKGHVVNQLVVPSTRIKSLLDDSQLYSFFC